MICYICKKEIREKQVQPIGKGLYRHKKCNPNQVKGNNMNEEKQVTPETPVVETPKVEEKKKRGRGRPKGSRNKPKVKKDEQETK